MVEFTPKQVRNGATGSTAAGPTAMPSMDLTSTISSLASSAMASAADGPPTTVSAGVVDWETGIAGHDQAGDA